MFFHFGYPQISNAEIGITFPYGFPQYSPGPILPEQVNELWNMTDQGFNVQIGNETVGFRGVLIPVEEGELAGCIALSPFELTPDVSRHINKRLRIIPNQNPPERVANLTAQSGLGQRTILRWTNPADTDLHSLRILRRTDTYPTAYDDENAVLVATIEENSPGVALSYEDVGLVDGETYYYTILARDLCMHWTTSVVPGENGATAESFSPSQVQDFLATDSESGQVTLTWTNPPESSLAEISVRRKVGSYPTDESDGDEVLTDASPVAGEAQTYVDTVAPGTYYYAVFPSGLSGYNQLVTAGRNADTGTAI